MLMTCSCASRTRYSVWIFALGKRFSAAFSVVVFASVTPPRDVNEREDVLRIVEGAVEERFEIVTSPKGEPPFGV